ncbi:MAG: glycosyltransferase [Prosthecobacter sp.]|nr:glycosyltransferase [Prosthecobacter sp.]
MKKKVLHILAGLDRGGCEGNALCLILQAREYDHHGLILGVEGEMSAEFVSAGTELRYLNKPSKFPWKLSALIQEQVADIAPDGVIIWHGMVMLPQTLHALSDTGVPILVHGGNPAHSMPLSVDVRYLLLEKVLGKRASALYVCCSRHVADSFRESRYLRRFPRAVVPNGVKDVLVHSMNEKQFDCSKKLVIGMVARLDEIKDHMTLLRAFKIVLKSHPQVQLELVGDGVLRASLEAMAKELGITETTRFWGQVAEPYVVMRDWDLFVYATTEKEGLGNALAEAMMMGIACVATNIGPISELVGDPPAALLVPPRDPEAMAAGIIELLQHPDMQHTLSTAGQERARAEFSASIFAQRYLELLDRDRRAL